MRDSSSIGCAIITDEASPVHSDTGVEDPDAASCTSSDSAIPCGDAGMREGGTGTVDAGEGCSEPAACAGTMLGSHHEDIILRPPSRTQSDTAGWAEAG